MDINSVIQIQRKFFATQATRGIKFRINAIKRLRETIYKYEDKIYAALWQDLHRSKAQAYMTEIGLCLQETRLFIRHLKKWAKPERKAASGLFPFSACCVQPEPFGTVLIISPWNYPVFLSIVPLIAAVAAGNCVVLKPSRNSRACLEVLNEMISECFPPEHVKTLVMEKGATYDVLDAKFDFIFFTGGPETGKKVLEASAKNINPVVLELGGKCPCIVDSDISLKKAADRIAMAKFTNAGQTCIAPDYILVQKNIKDRLIAELKKSILKMYTKDPKKSADFGRIINAAEYRRVASYIKGAEIVHGGSTDMDENYVEPTIVVNPKEGSAVMLNEIFGPILPVIEYEDLQEAIDFVNKREKPLVLYIFTRDKKLADRVLRETSSGGACVNDALIQMASPDLPFGGAGASGFGRYKGKYGFDTFSNLKSITKQTNLFDISLRYPPIGKTAQKLFKRILK